MVAKTGLGHASEVAAGDRFTFGENWRNFLEWLNDDRIEAACCSMRGLLETDRLTGKSFLDIGSGSGLFSLAAMRLGADRVCSFDYDPQSVTCTRELRKRYFPDDPRWAVLEGSVLDGDFVSSLGEYDVVYSWGVLHHTGDMWGAIENAAGRVAPGGLFALAIYNDQGKKSEIWKKVKKLYCRTPRRLRGPLFFPIPLAWELLRMVKLLSQGKMPLRNWWKAGERGMSPWHDWIDWLGGYPFDVAKPEEIFSFLRSRGFLLQNLVTCLGRLGNNEYVFRRQ